MAAVPLWQEDLKRVPWEDIAAELPEIGQTIASQGDILLYRSKKKGETAKVFNATAKGIAALSFMPGGVTVFGLHFEATHPDLEATTG